MVTRQLLVVGTKFMDGIADGSDNQNTDDFVVETTGG